MPLKFLFALTLAVPLGAVATTEAAAGEVFFSETRLNGETVTLIVKAHAPGDCTVFAEEEIPNVAAGRCIPETADHRAMFERKDQWFRYAYFRGRHRNFNFEAVSYIKPGLSAATASRAIRHCRKVAADLKGECIE